MKIKVAIIEGIGGQPDKCAAAVKRRFLIKGRIERKKGVKRIGGIRTGPTGENGEKNEMLPYKEFPDYIIGNVRGRSFRFYPILHRTYPCVIRPENDDDPNTNFDNLPELPDIKLDEHQFAIIEQW